MAVRVVVLCLLLAAALSAQKAGDKDRVASPGNAPAAASDEYRIGEGDVLQISVWGEPAASVPSVVVRPDGNISIPLLKDVKVAGLTPAQVEKIITEGLADFIKAANVTVMVAQINSKKVYLLGAVKKEGTIPYSYRMTVMQALSEAGGLTDYAKRKKIYVMRNENGKESRLPFDYDAVVKGQHMELNIPLLPGDTIVVPH
jgi:polysaccharide biosynthesis/export protein